MADLKHLSDEELDAAIEAKSGPDLSQLSDADLDHLISKKSEEHGLVEKAGEILGYPARVARTAITAAASPEYSAADVKDQASHIFPWNTKRPAISGEEQMKKLGVSDQPITWNLEDPLSGYQRKLPTHLEGEASLAQVLGAGAEMVQDPLMFPETTGKVLGLPLKAAGKVAGLAGRAGESALEGTAKLGSKLLSGVKSEGALGSYSRGLGKAIATTVERTAPKLSPEFERLSKIAESIGIPKDTLADSVKYGSKSDLAKIQRVLGEMPGGEQFAKQHSAVKDSIIAGLENESHSLAGNRTKDISDHIGYGNKLTEDFQKGQDLLRQKVDFDRAMVYKDNPQFQMSVDAYERTLKDIDKNARTLISLSDKAIDPTVSQQALRASNILTKSFENLSTTSKAADVHKEIQQLGEIAFGDASSRAAPQVKSALRQAYFDLTKIYDTNVAKQLGPDVANSIEESNKVWKEWFNSSDDFSKTLASGDDPEKVFKRLVRSGGSGELQKYRTFMMKNNPEGLANAKSLFMKDLVDQASTQGGFSFGKYKSLLESPANSGRMKILFSNEELNRFKDIADLGIEHGDSIFNASKTEVSGGFKKFLKETNKRAQLEALQESLRKRALNPEGLPINEVKSGNMLVPDLAEKSMNGGVSPKERFPLMQLIRAPMNAQNAMSRRREKQ